MREDETNLFSFAVLSQLNYYYYYYSVPLLINEEQNAAVYIMLQSKRGKRKRFRLRKHFLIIHFLE